VIGLYGLYSWDRDRPVSIAAMAAAVDRARYDTLEKSGPGAAIGAAVHRSVVGAAHDFQGDLCVVVTGDLSLPAAHLRDVGAPPDAGPAAVVRALYAAGALDVLADANGLFAAVLYDRRAHRLVLITDRVGGYPIHIQQDGDRLVFAGQIAVLLAEGATPRRADPDGLAQLFTLQRTVGRTTNIAGVAALPAATIATVENGALEERVYWSLNWSPGYRDDREAGADLAEAMRGALEAQTGPDSHHPGLLLSGGLDSRMVLGAAQRGRLACFTTASYAENPELALARMAAADRAASFTPLVVDPPETLSVLDRTTLDCNGLYPASTQISAFMEAVGAACDVALTGHGLDYTFRGYYLPARFLRFAGTSTRLPSARATPARPNGATVLENLRQGPPQHVIKRLVRPEKAGAWWDGQAHVMQQVLAPWLDGPEPLNAWDAFILHNLSKHYAFTGMMAVRAAVHLRLPTFDRAVFDVYLRLSPAQRVGARTAIEALRRVDASLARLPNANTGFAADLGPWREIGGVLLQAAGRKLGMLRRPEKPSGMHSAGSWQDIGVLYREDPGHRRHFLAIRNRLDSLTLGLLDPDALAACIDEHLEGRASHSKLLRYLLTHDAWVRQMDIRSLNG